MFIHMQVTVGIMWGTHSKLFLVTCDSLIQFKNYQWHQIPAHNQFLAFKNTTKAMVYECVQRILHCSTLTYVWQGFSLYSSKVFHRNWLIILHQIVVPHFPLIYGGQSTTYIYIHHNIVMDPYIYRIFFMSLIKYISNIHLYSEKQATAVL